jgi:DNA-binding response OmpR family regulator
MSRTIACPRCRHPHDMPDGPGAAADDAVCGHCGAQLAEGTAGSAPPPTVLCIDDDPLVLHFYREFLHRHGYRVRTAAEGLPGIELARQDRPDAVLLDVMLRGPSGFDVCRKFRADPALRDIPIILITVWDHPNVVHTGTAAGATLTLRKPADAETILTAMAQVLGRSGPPAPEGA